MNTSSASGSTQAYVGCPEFLSEFKDFGSLTDKQRNWNNTLQFFRGLNEHLVAAVKSGRHTLDTTWRGSFAGLSAVLRVVMHMVTLEERMLGPRYDCFGPCGQCVRVQLSDGMREKKSVTPGLRSGRLLLRDFEAVVIICT